jgi:hydroxymethylpyrimidine/phosphomethylpyrimidine kinase
MSEFQDANPKSRAVTIAIDSTVLTIAGSDPSGGAGLQVDLKAFQQTGCYGMAVVTLLTVQNTMGVRRVEVMDSELVGQQLTAVLEDIPPRALKTGALGNAQIITEVSELLEDVGCPVIVDPVLVSKNNDSLADDDAVEAYRSQLFPRAVLVTPNRFEAERLVGRELKDLQSIADAASEIQQLGPAYVLIKAGDFDGVRHHMIATPSGVVGLELKNLDTPQTHGAGCALSAVIAARLALTVQGEMKESVMRSAIDFAVAAVHHAIEFAPNFGAGRGPIESRMLHVGD